MPTDRPDGSPTAVDVVLRPEWSAVNATDKNFLGTAANVATGLIATAAYTVPAGKTLYVTLLGFSIFATLAADRDLNQIGWVAANDNTLGVTNVAMGGNGGGCVPLNKPLKYAAGTSLEFRARNLSNHNCELLVFAAGYEL